MKGTLFLAALVLATGLFFSCTSERESLGDISGSSNYCVFLADELCLPAHNSSTCPSGGQLSNTCPYSSASDYSSSGGISSSSGENESESSSSGVVGVSSSSGGAELPSFGFCIFSTDKICWPGPVSKCPQGAELGDVCPYSSSSAGVPSSSSNLLGISSSSSSISLICPSATGNVFVDPRDCQEYKYEVAPNGKIWMSDNLNYSKDNTLGYCWGVDIDDINPHQDAPGCNNGYGRVYEYAVAIDGNPPQGLCPPGWHIPSTVEWSYVISEEMGRAYRKMSSDFYIYAGNYNVNSEYPPLGWKDKGKSGFYWTSNGNSYYTGFWQGPDSNYPSNPFEEAQTTTIGGQEKFSVRCISNESPTPSSSSAAPSSSSVASIPSSSSATPSSSSYYGNSSSSSLFYYEGQYYRTVRIGTQTWFAENLNYNPGTGTSSCYGGQASYCTQYGRLYDWSTANTVCPYGWHLPTNADWDRLLRYIDGNSDTYSPYSSSTAGKYLKTADWGGTDSYGFSALPGGNGYSDGSFSNVGDDGSWWSAGEISSDNAYYRYMNYSYDYAGYYYNSKDGLYSVRCLQD